MDCSISVCLSVQQRRRKRRRRTTTSGYSSVVRAPDSWSKGRGFESLLERRENFLLQGPLSVLTLISVSVPSPVLPQQHVKDPGHSAKRAGGRLQLNTHTPYVCGFAWSDMVHGCMVYTQRCKCTASVDIQKRAIRSYSLMQNYMRAQWVCSRPENNAI